MSIATQDLFKVIYELTAIKEMKVALNVTGQCGLIASLMTMAGGFLGGPPGIAVGGLIGTVMASYHSHGKFKSVPEIIMNDASIEQKEKLASSIRNLLSAENIFTLVQFMTAIQNNKLLKEAIQKIVQDFVSTCMGYQIVN